MAGVEGVPTIRTLEEWNAFVEAEKGRPAFLQCGSPVCVRCAPFAARIEQLRAAFHFRWAYVNTHDAEEDLLEELQVAKLPAYRIVRHLDSEKGTEMEEGQNSTPEELTKAIQRMCPTALGFGDEDF